MGMFNSIRADLECPAKGEIGAAVEIQIKWQAYAARALTTYQLGDLLEDIEPEYDNAWIRTDYICPVCSKHTAGWRGVPFIKTDDQQRHFVFVRVENGRIQEILTEKEFKKTGVTGFVDDW